MALTKVAILGLSLSLRVPSKFLRKFKVIDGLFFSAENIPSLGQRTGRTLAALHLETNCCPRRSVSRCNAANIPSLGQRTGRTLAALHLETERLGQQFVSR